MKEGWGEGGEGGGGGLRESHVCKTNSPNFLGVRKQAHERARTASASKSSSLLILLRLSSARLNIINEKGVVDSVFETRARLSKKNWDLLHQSHEQQCFINLFTSSLRCIEHAAVVQLVDGSRL